ncbi:MAG: HD domain-containing protein [Pyramidobacter porci]|uniref:HD domain-containing protein n=1 Tax=Pyramidobacter porci TaxID=2605789 RepID=UPI002A74BA5E|nr:HD domain-containing protein [Pyramidobacter porci]MDY2648873.1 HD domain-containing protein [Pyramidobacter porci]
MYQFRDPIHGFIDVSDDELKIIDSAPFQRLRNIRQLATTYLVYHGAEHSRFGHSIGVMYLTSRVFDSVTRKVPNLFADDGEENAHKTAWYRQLLRLIGLTHDLGHAPFSHASEELFEAGKEHEDFTKLAICETEISGYIREIGAKFKKQHGDRYDITPELVWMIYEGKDILNEEFIVPDFFFLKSFMDGELDCDKMDYLLRDSLYCGVTYGTYDLDRFIATLTAYKRNNQLQLAIEKGGVQALEEFILARYFMFIQVYFHKTRRYLDKALVKSLKAVLPGGKYPDDVLEYLRWNDARILDLIAGSEDSDVVAFKSRKIMTCVFESQTHAEQADKQNTKLIFNQLRKKYGGRVLYDSVDKAAHRLAPALLAPQDDSGRGIMILDEGTGDVKNIMEESIILDSIVKPISINRIYADKNIAAEVRKEIQRIRSE